MSTIHIENYRLLGETLIVIAAEDYIESYWRYKHLNKPKYRRLWEEKHRKTCKEEFRLKAEWTSHCNQVEKQVKSIETFFRDELDMYCEIDIEWFIKRLRKKALSGKKTFYETV